MFVVFTKRNLAWLCSAVFVLTLICGVIVFASKNEKEDVETVNLPIIMYHSVLKDTSKSGKYVVTPSEIENDFKYIKENGYTSVLADDLIDYVNGKDLPEKPIMITLDDGYLNNITYVLPLLEKYDLKAVISVVGSYTEMFSKETDHNPNYSHFNFDDINLLIKSGRVEIANHTYDLHKLDGRSGCCIKYGENKEEYKNMLENDLMRNQRLLYENTSYMPITFTYPYGSCCETSKEVIEKLGFKVSLGCEQQVNRLSRNPESLYMLGRFNRESNVSTKDFMQRFEKDLNK